jgi:hypothetical protein
MSGKFSFLANSACDFKAYCWTLTGGFSGKCKSIQHSQIAMIYSLLFLYNSSNSYISGKKSASFCGISHGCHQIAVSTTNQGKSEIDSFAIWIHF